jgi:hypothetical protein
MLKQTNRLLYGGCALIGVAAALFLTAMMLITPM